MFLFFTFLTWYSAYFNKVTDCGCFGDAIKLTPWESFTKDVVLLVMIGFIFFKQDIIKPIVAKNTQKIITGLSLIFCFYITYYVLNHLPILDFRAYKIGDNLIQNMAIPEDAPKDLYEYEWKFKEDGQEKTYVTNGEYPNVSGDFIEVETKLIQKGYEPSIYDFSIEVNGNNLTNEILSVNFFSELTISNKSRFIHFKIVSILIKIQHFIRGDCCFVFWVLTRNGYLFVIRTDRV